MSARAVIYARVSRDTTGQGKSVEQQIAECTKTCVQENWEIAEIVTDNSISASRYAAKQRPGYESLKNILEPEMILVVWEFSRAGRRTQEHLALQELCEERGVLFRAGSRNYDFRKSEDRFMGTLESAIAAKSSDETRERVLRDKRAAAEKGRPNGSLGFGFLPIIDPDTFARAWILDPTTAPLVKDAATAILAGASLHSIVKDWNQRGIKTFKGNIWRSITLRQLLLRPAIAGLRQHQGQTTTVKAVWPPIITEQEHRALVAIFTDPSRKTQRGSEVKHLLTNIALCGKCNQPVVRMSPNAKLQRGSRYACPDRHVTRNQAEVDKRVVSELLRIMDDTLADEFLMDETGAADGMDSPSEHHLTKAAELQQQLDDATAEFIAGRLTAATLGRIEAALLPQIDQERRSAAERTSNPLLAKLAAGAAGAWKAADISERRAMLRAAVVVTIHPVGKGGTHVFDPNGVTVAARQRHHVSW
ncbi:recombinase family protein [Rhodococcoides yunnanense]|uniref:Recombinase family protein n=1 Tax=Rhodococcoides yunnanense TaxID=278209 RepID=A0ABU4BDP7_9NOCA|nr:recombinase family protein [Rhodococcus yunnanensis]MDV6262342.1 recombinase family protein [Rhodococcus yunnanensis]